MEWEIFEGLVEEYCIEEEGGYRSVIRRSDFGSGVRVYKNGKVYFSHFPHRIRDIKRVIKDLPSSIEGMPLPADPIPEGKEIRGETADFQPRRAEEIFEEMSSVLKSFSDIYVDELVFTLKRMIVKISNSKGLVAEGETSGIVITVGLICTGGGDRAYFWDSCFYDFHKEILPEKEALNFVEDARKLVPAWPIKTGIYPAVLSPEVLSELFEIMSYHLSAHSLYTGDSIFIGKEGETLFSEEISIVDNPDSISPWFSLPFDGEGIERDKKVLVERGRFVDYMYNSMFANVYRKEARGHSKRDSFRDELSLSGSCLLLDSSNKEDIVERLGDGVIISKVIGGHTVDKITGEFSVGVDGYVVKNGEWKRAFRGATLSGNIFSLLKNVKGVGKDLKVYNNYAVPSIFVSEVVIGGEG